MIDLIVKSEYFWNSKRSDFIDQVIFIFGKCYNERFDSKDRELNPAFQDCVMKSNLSEINKKRFLSLLSGKKL